MPPLYRTGFAVFDNLPEGKYTLKEQVPAGYKTDLPADGLEVIIKKDKLLGVVIIYVENKKLAQDEEWKGNIRVFKSIAGKSTSDIIELSGFVFELWDEDGLVDGPYTTDEFGEVNFVGIEAGTYEVRELPRDGYTQISPEGPAFVTIGPDSETGGDDNYWLMYFMNREDDTPPPLREIIVQKVVEGLEDLSGFKFILHRRSSAGEEFVAELTTDSTGLLNFGEQDYGEYVLYEEYKKGFEMGIGDVESEDGHSFYHPENTEEPIEIVNWKIQDIPNEGEIDVTKVVRDENGTTIPDNSIFTFRLEKWVDEVWVLEATKTIVGNGNVKFTGLDDGEYRVIEINTPGYTLISPNNILVTLYEENAGTVVFVNRKNSSPPSNEYPDPQPTPRSTPDPEPQPEPELPEEEEVIEEPVPEAEPELEPEPEVDAEDIVKEEEEVVEEAVPEAKAVATLPKTGAASPLITTGLGTLILAVGLYLRKRR